MSVIHRHKLGLWIFSTIDDALCAKLFDLGKAIDRDHPGQRSPGWAHQITNITDIKVTQFARDLNADDK